MGGATAPVCSSASAPGWTASVSKASSSSSITASWHRLPAVRRPVELEPELLAVELVPADAGLPEAQPPDDSQRPIVRRRDRRPEACDAVLYGGPVEQRPDRFGGEAATPEPWLDVVADLDLAGLVRWAVESHRADDTPNSDLVAQHHRPRHPRQDRRVAIDLRQPALEQLAETLAQPTWHRGAELGLGRREIAVEHRAHRPRRERHERQPR